VAGEPDEARRVIAAQLDSYQARPRTPTVARPRRGLPPAATGPRSQAALTTPRALAPELRAAPLRTEVETLAKPARIALGELPVNAAERIGLTARELDVVRGLAAGASNRESARSCTSATRPSASMSRDPGQA
jgi:DNA-binding NarL/FixJ family response regulator